MTNHIEKLQTELRKLLPRTARLDLAQPKRSDGVWLLSIQKPSSNYAIEVEWRPHRGFGISAGRELEFGTGVHEVFGSLDATTRRISDLYRSGNETNPCAPVSLRELRILRGTSQSALAEELAVTNGLIAQRESGAVGSMKVQTLVQFVEALGGSLDIVVKLPDAEPRSLKLV